MAKHFKLEIGDTSFRWEREHARIREEENLDGLYVIRTRVPAEALSAEQTVAAYKNLSRVERAFRSIKTVDLKVRPIHHRLVTRVRAHVLLCMLAYYVEWHMREALAPMLFDDHDRDEAVQQRANIVAPAVRSPAARHKAAAKRTPDGQPVHSFQTLLDDLGTIVRNRIQPRRPGLPWFPKTTRPTPLQQKALDLLRVAV